MNQQNFDPNRCYPPAIACQDDIMNQLVDCREKPQEAYKAVYCEEYATTPEPTTTEAPATTTTEEPCGVYEVCQIAAAFNSITGSASQTPIGLVLLYFSLYILLL